MFAQSFVQAQIKKISKVCVTGLCEANPPLTDGFSSQRASNAEHVSIWWRHHGMEAHKNVRNYFICKHLHVSFYPDLLGSDTDQKCLPWITPHLNLFVLAVQMIKFLTLCALVTHIVPLIQVMLCDLFGAKSLIKPKVTCCQLDPQEQRLVNLETKGQLVSFKINAFQNVVCKMTTNLSWPHCGKEGKLNWLKLFGLCERLFGAVICWPKLALTLNLHFK